MAADISTAVGLWRLRRLISRQRVQMAFLHRLSAVIGRDRIRTMLVVGGVLAVVVAGVWVAGRRSGGSDWTDRTDWSDETDRSGGADGSDGADHSIGQTVSGFFLAQRDGDCDRLIDLVTEASWSDGGRLSRVEFLEQCAEAVEGHEPEVEQVDLDTGEGDGDRSREPDRAVVVGFVTPTVTADGVESGDDTDDPEHGHLVREDGEWRVATGIGVLRIGRSVEQTVLGYLDAYNDGDCERLVDHLSEASWSQDGELTRPEAVDQCGEAADARRARPWQPPVRVTVLDVLLDGTDRATVDVTAGEGTALFPMDPERVIVVREGLEWKLHGSQAEPSDEVDVLRPLPILELFELQAQLLGEVTAPDGTCFSYRDDRDSTDHLGPDRSGDRDDQDRVGVRRQFHAPCDSQVDLVLQRLPDDEARAAADAGPAFPGIPDALGFRSSCDDESCDQAVATAVRNGVLVRVQFAYGGDLDAAVAMLRAQLERLG